MNWETLVRLLGSKNNNETASFVLLTRENNGNSLPGGSTQTLALHLQNNSYRTFLSSSGSIQLSEGRSKNINYFCASCLTSAARRCKC
jgi:hypothetical protein